MFQEPEFVSKVIHPDEEVQKLGVLLPLSPSPCHPPFKIDLPYSRCRSPPHFDLTKRIREFPGFFRKIEKQDFNVVCDERERGQKQRCLNRGEGQGQAVIITERCAMCGALNEADYLVSHTCIPNQITYFCCNDKCFDRYQYCAYKLFDLTFGVPYLWRSQMSESGDLWRSRQQMRGSDEHYKCAYCGVTSENVVVNVYMKG